MPAVQSDGIAAHGVGSALMVALYAQRRGITMPNLVTTMLGNRPAGMITYNTGYARPTGDPAGDDRSSV